MGRYEQAVPVFIEAMEISRTVLGEDHPDYASDMNHLAMLYCEMGNYEAAEPLYRQAMEIRRVVFGEDHPDYAIVMNNLAELYRETGNFSEAESLYMQALEINRTVYGDFHPDVALVMNNMALLYHEIGIYEAAESLYKDVILIWSEVLGEGHPLYSNSLNNLAELYRESGDYSAAEPLYDQAIGIDRIVFGEHHPRFALDLNNKALMFVAMGNYTDAESLYYQAIEILRESYGEEHPEFATSLNNLAQLYQFTGNYPEAELLLTQALEIRRKVYGEHHPDFAMSLNNLAVLYSLVGNYEAAFPLQKQASDLQLEIYGAMHPSYATSLNNLAQTYLVLGYYEEARTLFQQALDIKSEIIGTESPSYSNTLNNLAILNAATGNYAAAGSMFSQVSQNISHNIQENFSFMSPGEKENYIKTVGINYEVFHSFMINYYADTSDLSSQGYSNELLRKGLILNSVTSMQLAILESGDNELITRFGQLQALRHQINYWQQKPIAERGADLEALQQQAYEIEKELTRASKDFAQTVKQFSVSWKDVQATLENGEAAIEFISFGYYSGLHWSDSTLYCALVLRKEYEYPRLVYLFEQRQLDSLLLRSLSPDDNSFITQLYTRGTNLLQSSVTSYGTELYELIWAPVDSLLSGIRTICFAPSGSLNQIAFSALPHPDGRLLMDRYDLIQLSSTRELAMDRNEMHYSPDFTIALYGDITYYSDTARMMQEALAYNRSEGASRYYHIRLEDTLSAFIQLPGTSAEIQGIDAILESECDLFSGSKASEESFKSLSGNDSPEVIHIATHGFFFADPLEKPDGQMDLILTGQQQFTLADDPLQRSGLVFAGANHYWTGEDLPQGVEDGLVTAKEVSTMNLTNTKLVVMSACETGLGEIQGSEGVFGLQRGFKMAGVNTLIMSLWKVPDAETAEFMQAFYSEWRSGKPMRQAFLDTQRQMKEKYPDDPYKWAAFVMVE